MGPICTKTQQNKTKMIAHLFGAATALALAAPAYAQTGWLLPTNSGVTAPNTGMDDVLPRAVWAVPTGPVRVRNAAGASFVTPSVRPDQQLFVYGTVVTTGFAGWELLRPITKGVQDNIDPQASRYRFIDPNGVVATLMTTGNVGHSFNASEVSFPIYDKILARDVGQVFGIAIDSDEERNLFLTATSVFGLNIVNPDLDRDGLPDRLKAGEASADWMPAQWGSHAAAGPGSVWRVDGATGQVALFANITLNGVENTGPGLGNIAFDPAHNQFFVTDLQTGMIHRLDETGRELEYFDHGLNGRADVGLPVAYDPSRAVPITSPMFDAEDSKSWGFAEPARKVWGVTVHGGRLFYTVDEGTSVFSIGIDVDTGALLNDAQWELSLDESVGELSDLVFSGDGAMIVAERAVVLGDLAHETLTTPDGARVWRFVLEAPVDDPTTRSRWVPQSESYPVGFGQNNARALGGVAVGPRYDDEGYWDANFCGATLWSTGQDLRDEPTYYAALSLGGSGNVDGVMAQPVVKNTTGNTPPWESYFADYDRLEDVVPALYGHVGDVEVLGCRGGSGGNPGDYGKPGGEGGGGNPNCVKAPWLCVPKPAECLKSIAVAVCDSTTGTYNAVVAFGDTFGNGLDRIKISEPTGILPGLPTESPLNTGFSASLGLLAPGQQTELQLCAFRGAEADLNQPYSCCNASVSLVVPTEPCLKETE